MAKTGNPIEFRKVLTLLVGGSNVETVRRFAVLPPPDGLGLTAAYAETLIADVRVSISEAGSWDRVEQIGMAISRLNVLYAKAHNENNIGAAFQIQKELNNLMGLRGSEQSPDDGATAPGSDAARELEAVRSHLAPLQLAPAGTTVSELARLAVQRIVEGMSK